METIASNATNIPPKKFPPTERTAHFHSLRMFYQVRIWQTLDNHDANPLDWGWEIKEGKLKPIRTDKEAAPNEILSII